MTPEEWIQWWEDRKAFAVETLKGIQFGETYHRGDNDITDEVEQRAKDDVARADEYIAMNKQRGGLN